MHSDNDRRLIGTPYTGTQSAQLQKNSVDYVSARRRKDGRCPSSLIKSRAFADRQQPGTPKFA
jgi:hypothetical protein